VSQIKAEAVAVTTTRTDFPRVAPSIPFIVATPTPLFLKPHAKVIRTSMNGATRFMRERVGVEVLVSKLAVLKLPLCVAHTGRNQTHRCASEVSIHAVLQQILTLRSC